MPLKIDVLFTEIYTYSGFKYLRSVVNKHWRVYLDFGRTGSLSLQVYWLLYMRVAVNSYALPVYMKHRISSLLCIFETTVQVNLRQTPFSWNIEYSLIYTLHTPRKSRVFCKVWLTRIENFRALQSQLLVIVFMVQWILNSHGRIQMVGTGGPDPPPPLKNHKI